MRSEVSDFIKHLRLPYQIFILSGAFLYGALIAAPTAWFTFVLQFLNLHILIYGGVTVYNSFYDKDEGPIGGLKTPPKMKPWMLTASWICQLIGLLIAAVGGPVSLISCGICLLFFWMYSSPRIRLKGRPIASLLAIGIAAGICPVLMGYLSLGGQGMPTQLWTTALGVTCLFLALYPVSQAYQVEEDRKRGDRTFAVVFGLPGIRYYFICSYSLGSLLVTFSLARINLLLGSIFGMGAVAAGVFIWFFLRQLKLDKKLYEPIMQLKYVTGVAFSLFAVLILFGKSWGILSG